MHFGAASVVGPKCLIPSACIHILMSEDCYPMLSCGLYKQQILLYTNKLQVIMILSASIPYLTTNLNFVLQFWDPVVGWLLGYWLNFQKTFSLSHRNTFRKRLKKDYRAKGYTTKTKQDKVKNKCTMQCEQQWQSLTSSGTINSIMFDSDLTITTSPLTSSAPYSRCRSVQILSYALSFCCRSGSNRKIQPWYWLATINNTRRKHKADSQKRRQNMQKKSAEEK
jgi:small-conductance mechanosensitive channel